MLLRFVLIPIIISSFSFFVAAESTVSTELAFEQRMFWQSPAQAKQSSSSSVIKFETEYTLTWDDGLQSVVFKPFFQLDNHETRNTADIRELLWVYNQDTWAMRAGIGKVFWGQTESFHLVDTINQTDILGGVDGEDKLGQPMLNLEISKSWGSASFFVLPYFRAREYPDETGRLRFTLPVHDEGNLYESGQKEKHIDIATRWVYFGDNWEGAISYFDGTTREPSFIVSEEWEKSKLTAYYPQMQQVGLEALYTSGSWLLKLEAVQRRMTIDTYNAFVSGFEYTEYGVFNTAYDVGWIVEYQYDDRDSQVLSIAQNDFMVGARVILNDIASSEFLVGYVQDLDVSSSNYSFIEASSRLSDTWKLTAEARVFNAKGKVDVLHYFKQDDFVEVSLQYYF